MEKMVNIIKRRLLTVLLAFAMMFGIFSAVPMSANAAKCANWYITSTGKPYCKDGGCGAFWLSDTEYQKVNKKRKCIKGNGNTYYEKKTITNNLGCCD